MTERICGTGGWAGPLPGDPDNNVILSATSVFGGIRVSWTYPTLNPHAVAHVLLYRGTSPDFNLVGSPRVVNGNIFYDQIDEGDLNIYFYWMQIVSINGTPGDVVGPASATKVAIATQMLTLLNGQLTESALYVDLQTKIDNIALNEQSIQDEIQDRLADSSAMTAAFAVFNSDLEDTNTLVMNEITERQEALLAEATSRNLLAAQLRGTYPGSDISFLTSGLLYEEKQVRASEDSALASSISILSATVESKTATYRRSNVPMLPTDPLVVGDLWIDTGSQNHCLYSEDFSQTVWTKGSNVYGPDTVVSPVDGSVLTLIAAVTANRPSQSVIREIGKSYVTSVRVKAGTSNWFRLRSNALAAWFDLSTGTVGSVNTDAAGIINEGDGIYRCWVREVQTSTWHLVEAMSVDANASATPTGTMYMGAVQVEEDVTLPGRYIKTLGTMVSTVGNNTLLMWDGINWVIVDNALLASNTAAIQSEATARATADDALASDITTLSTTVSGHTTSIQTNATSINGLSAQYTVKIDANGYVTGFGLASTPVNGTPYSEFTVVADKFSIAPVATDSGAADGSPFFHLTSPTTIGGVSVPAGTYMKSAFIHDASITNAKIGNVIQSANYAAGTAGWKIDKAGNMELNAAVFRGTIDVKSATTNARLEIKNDVIKVYDSNNNLRVRIGNLSA
jgi:hypothetical protein